MLFSSPQKICISIVFSFSWGHFNSQEKLKTMLMQNFGVTNKEHYGMLWYFWSIVIIEFARATLSHSLLRPSKQHVSPLIWWLSPPLTKNLTYLFTVTPRKTPRTFQSRITLQGKLFTNKTFFARFVFLVARLIFQAWHCWSVNRGYYKAARRYEISLRVLKNIVFSTREEKFRISKRPCNVLFII